MHITKEAPLTQDSYYTASAPKITPSQSLQGDVRADVCIVGAGLAGLSAAIDLAKAGRKVVVLEAHYAGWGASGRNGGQALTDVASGMTEIESQLGNEAAQQVWRTTIEAVELIKQRCAEFNIQADWQAGYLSVAQNARKSRALKESVERTAKVYGHNQQLIEPKDLPQWIASSKFDSGAYDPTAGHLHPLKYTQGLARAARSLGVLIYEQSVVINIKTDQNSNGSSIPKERISTANGSVIADQVLLAGNVYMSGLADHLSGRVMPVGTYIVCTEPMDEARSKALIPTRACICDTNFVLDYFRPTADHRMLFGGRVSYSAKTPINLKGSMRKRMLDVFPQLHDVQVAHSWGGFVDITMNRAPDFGRIKNNVYYLQGFSGHGLALTGMAGRMVARAMQGDSAQFDVFARIKHRQFPGGALLRMPSLVVGMAWYRLRDLF
jgi:gamma-glutamylputrescine oxidase